jgi:hypothetical protein
MDPPSLLETMGKIIKHSHLLDKFNTRKTSENVDGKIEIIKV